VIIRLATSEDKAEWLRMRRALWPECSEDRHLLEIEQLAASGGIVLVVAREGQSLSGFIAVSIRRDHVPGGTATPIPYIEGWYVDEDCGESAAD
jgi:aminoglycoside 6'-N-acetyltransferase I